AVLHQTSDVLAVRQTSDRSVVAGRKNRAVPDDDGADMLARTSGAGRDLMRDVHEVVVPVDSLRHERILVCCDRQIDIRHLAIWSTQCRPPTWLMPGGPDWKKLISITPISGHGLRLPGGGKPGHRLENSRRRSRSDRLAPPVVAYNRMRNAKPPAGRCHGNRRRHLHRFERLRLLEEPARRGVRHPRADSL